MTNTFATATTQRDLDREIALAKLSAPEWIALANKTTGRLCRSGKSARDAVHTHYSNRLLLQDRITQVQQS